MLLRIVSIVFPLFAVAALGYVIGRRGQPDLSYANKLNMDVFVPALIFAALASRDFHIAGYAPLALAALVVVVGSGVAAWAIARAAGIEVKTLLPPIMFNNCGNLGLPLAVLAFGEQALAPAVVMFAVSNLMHFSYGAWLLDHHTRLTNLWRIPSVAATLLGIGVSVAGIELWAPLMQAIKLLGDVVIPLMLFSLGVRLADARLAAWRAGVLVAVARPVLGVAAVAALLLVIDLPPMQRALLLVFGALPPAILNYMFAERYRQEPHKVASMVMIGNLAAVLVLPLMLAFVLPAP
jgi:hypothetical protein